MVYAVGDIHGRLDCLQCAFEAIDHDMRKRKGAEVIEIYLGGYVDKGPDSWDVVETLIARRDQRNAIFLRSLHETLLLTFLKDEIAYDAWRSLCGVQTALSYGISRDRLHRGAPLRGAELAKLFPGQHFEFMSQTAPHFAFGSYCFVSALEEGIGAQSTNNEPKHRASANASEQTEHSAGAITVHGHRPVADAEFHPRRINIDTAAFATGRLSVVRIDASGVAALKVRSGRAWPGGPPEA